MRAPAAYRPAGVIAVLGVVVMIAVGACSLGTGGDDPTGPAPTGVVSPTADTSADGDASSPQTSTPPALPPATTPSENLVPGRVLVWSDEFDQPATTTPSSDDWEALDGGGGWGNDELQYYTGRPENVSVTGDGALRITARVEEYRGAEGDSASYTSARLVSVPAFRYGLIEARIKVPAGWGLWPAFWALGGDGKGRDWPADGEFDVMEVINEATVVHADAHAIDWEGAHWSRRGSVEVPGSVADDWHVYAVEWTTDSLAYSLDGDVYHRVSRTDLPGPWPFDRPFHLLLNVAVGGSWPGSPLDGSIFPASMLVDYVRVYDGEVVR